MIIHGEESCGLLMGMGRVVSVGGRRCRIGSGEDVVLRRG